MRNAATVLGIIHERGKRGLPLEDVYRQLFNPDLYLRAYGRIYANDGAMTPGTTPETADGMSLAKIEKLIAAIRGERYQWTPVRRVNIPKTNGKTRPLGIPTWSDKVLQEVIRSILEAYYEPQFSDHSHGFRPHRGCHTALHILKRTWTGTRWFIEGDIKGCFDNIDHAILLSILREKIHDNRFLRLIENLLKAGYCEQWTYHPTLSGTPQGGIVSPLLANIYLDRLDKFVVQTLLPAFNRGAKRKMSPTYKRLVEQHRRLRRQGRAAEAQEVHRRMQQMPSVDASDPAYRRLRYVRYADDFLLGFAGPKAEAAAIKTQLATFLREHLKLELSAEKTLITHATTQAARFLGYHVVSHYANDKHTAGGRSINGRIGLRMPADIIQTRRARYTQGGKPIHRIQLVDMSDYSIMARYQAEYRGYVQYYAYAQNVAWLSDLHWLMRGSLLKTLARKHHATAARMAKQYQSVKSTPHGPRRCLMVAVNRTGQAPLVAYFGGIPLRRQPSAVIKDHTLNTPLGTRTELEKRLLAAACEIRGATGKVEVHHIRKLADLKVKGRKAPPLWKQQMSAARRKTLVLCLPCHVDLHAGRPLRRAVA